MSTLAVIALVLVCICLAPFALSLVIGLLLLISGYVLFNAISIADFLSELPDKVHQRRMQRKQLKDQIK